ncbi:MAG: ribonuclease D [Halofilum sp. (in: g-proteobacteria)]
MSETPDLITTTDALAETVARLRERDWFALDTEFIREDTYWPQLCLIQVATDEHLACIDPLALADLEPFYALLADPAVTKVLHAADQDLEVFHLATGRLPAPVFDTQLAAPLLGFPEQAGYGRLVEALLDVRLTKGHARTDWRERPLPEPALRYAADDVRYLVPLYEALRAGLAARERLGWLEEEFARLTDAARYERAPEDAWHRLKGIDRLSGPGRSVIRALARWREQEARNANVPRGRILRDEALVDLARALPADRKQLGRLRSLRGRPLERYGADLLTLIEEAREQTPPELRTTPTLGPELDERGQALAEALHAVVHLRCAEHAVNPEIVVSRRDLGRIAGGEAASAILGGWRSDLVATDLDAFMAGRQSLRHDETGLQLG